MIKILIVEDSRFFMNVIVSNLQSAMDVELVCAESYEQAVQKLDANSDDIFLSLLDLNLPDAPDGEIVDLVRSQGIPMIVFSATFNEKLSQILADKGVIDYIVKDSPASLSYLVSTVKRIHRNKYVETLVVDDSSTFRRHMVQLLKQYNFNVQEARNGEEALAVIEQNPRIKLVVTDYNMPVMNGFDFIREVRKRFSRSRMAIVGVTGGGANNNSAKFLKVGANDFLTKPFSREEFFCRITQNMDNIEHVEALRKLATTDQLTGIPNRRRIFDEAKNFLLDDNLDDAQPVVAMIDIDKFKNVNDVYGHDVGDEVLKHTATLLASSVRETDIIARFGGEEFCYITSHMDGDYVNQLFEKMRVEIEKNPLVHSGEEIPLTVSIGVCTGFADTLDDMIKIADQALYRAKESGRNRVVVA